MKAPCRNLAVGQACSTSSSIITVFHDRLEYKFYHNTHGQIKMCMWFRDIGDAKLEGLRFTFHVRRALRHFGSEYDPSSKTDRLTLELCSQDNAAEFRRVASRILEQNVSSWPSLR